MKFLLVVIITALCSFASVKHSSAVCAHKPGFVYTISEMAIPPSIYYKVGGTTRSVHRRICELQNGNPRELVAVSEYSTDDCYDGEVAALNAAANVLGVTRVVINGLPTEWFRVPPAREEAFLNAVQNAANNNQQTAETQEDEKENYVQFLRAVAAAANSKQQAAEAETQVDERANKEKLAQEKFAQLIDDLLDA